jgi:AcrR family transcriptional regulator
MDTPAARTRLRRTQAQRRAGTRRRLLDAALECLVDHGYAGTTTTQVAERAGVSRGAQLHHFPTRADLVAAAIEHLFDRMRCDYQQAFSQAGGADAGVAVDLLWSIFEQRDFAAVLELYVAARTDADLRERLTPVAAAHERRVYELAREFFPHVPPDARDDVLRTVLDAMQGMAVSAFAPVGAPDRAVRLAALRRLAMRAIGDSQNAGRERRAAS